MRLLPKVRLVIDKPDLEIEPEVAAMMKKQKVKKDELPRFFTMKERLVIFVILGGTILIGTLFWLSGGAKLPESSSINTTSSSEPIIPKPQQNNSPFDWGGFNEHITIQK
jgi:hypothetical protein